MTLQGELVSVLPDLTSPLDLAEILSVKREQLEDLAQNASERYSVYPMFRGTKKRWIEAPTPELKSFQRRLLDRLLYRLAPTGHCHGFVRGRSIVSNAAQHVGRRWVITLDIRDFFPSVTDRQVRGIVQMLPLTHRDNGIVMALVTRRARLPQGAPTSPHLANLVFRLVDLQLAAFAKSRRWIYTRYADDLTFSGDTDPAQLVSEARQVIKEAGFRLSPEKTKVMSQHQRQVVTGLVVNKRVRLPKPTRRFLRAMLHHVRTDGWPDWDVAVASSVLGRMTFAAFVDPAEYHAQCRELSTLLVHECRHDAADRDGLWTGV